MHLFLDAAREGRHLGGRHPVIDLDVHAAADAIRTEVGYGQVVGAVHFREAADGPLHGRAERGIHTLSQDATHGTAQDVDARLDDDDGNDQADPCLQADAPRKVDECRG